MNRDKLIQELRAYAKRNDLFFDVNKKRGSGSHYLVQVGDHWTTIQSNIDETRARTIRKQLKIDPAK